jgi:hypothetical protein
MNERFQGKISGRYWLQDGFYKMVNVLMPPRGPTGPCHICCVAVITQIPGGKMFLLALCDEKSRK